MTPKEKAQELVRKYKGFEMTNERIAAKQCAIIAVDEIINETSLGLLLIQWWKEVKKEIELM